MAKYKKTEIPQFQDLHRGTSVTIPVKINRIDKTPFDLTGYKAVFTLKAEQYDHDYDDERALISREIEFDPEMAEKGRFNVALSSKDLWLHPGLYWFDIELIKGPSIARIALYKVEILGGPTNITVNHEVGDDIFLTDAIDITPTDRENIILNTPLVPDPPENIIETVVGSPEYIVRDLDDPIRNIQIQTYAPRLSLMMPFRVAMDDQWHAIKLQNFFGNFKIDPRCPLADSSIFIKNTAIKISGSRPLNGVFTDMCFKKYRDMGEHMTKVNDYSESRCENWNFEKGIHLEEGSIGRLHIQFVDGNDMINIEGTYAIPDLDSPIETVRTPDAQFAIFMLKLDWYNWIDPEILRDEEGNPVEPDDDKTIIGGKYPPGQDSYWPPNIHY